MLFQDLHGCWLGRRLYRDQEIADYAASIGAPVIMTSSAHNRATDRAAEATAKIEADSCEKVGVVVMVQGDEPLIMPDAIASLLPPFTDTSVQVANLITPIRSDADFLDKGNVKVVLNRFGNVIYFSREPIPCTWKNIPNTPRLQQLGIIAFRRDVLMDFSSSQETMLEQCESVDMNRIVENGENIRAVLSNYRTIGVDNEADLARAEAMMAEDALVSRYRTS